MTYPDLDLNGIAAGQAAKVNGAGTGWEFFTPAAAAYVPLTFVRNNVAAGLTASQALAPQNGQGFTVPAACTLKALTAMFTGAFGTGTITVRVRKNGSASNALELVASTGLGAGAVAVGTGVSFAAGDYLQVEVDTSGGFNGTSGVWTFTAWVQFA